MPNPPCDVCGKVLVGGPAHLRKHMLIHTNPPENKQKQIGNPPCDVCGKVISGGSENFRAHVRIHTGERPYKCDVEGCEKAYNKNSKLTVHKRTHTGERPYKCDVDGCDSAFIDSSDLSKHKRIHTGEKPYKCDVDGCDYACTESGSLIMHKRTHTGERPFKCDVDDCDYVCASTSRLTVHKRSHTGEKPYKCDVDGCDYACTRSCGLNLHKRIHTGEKPYKCDADGCDAVFTQSSGLEYHKQTHHSKEGVKRRKTQEHAMQIALIIGGYTESFNRGVVPPPGQFTREVYFDHRCALARDFMPGEKKYAYVDFVVTTPDGRLVFLEVDEEQHDYLPQLCETTRMWNICESIVLADLGGDINVFWLRVSPNVGYHVGGQTLRTPRDLRLKEVIKFLDNLKSSPSDPMIQIGYAYYDCESNGKPLVLQDPEYHPDVLTAVVSISRGSRKLIQPRPFAPVNPLFASVGPSDLTAAAFEDVPPGDAGGSSGKRQRVQ